MIDRAFAWSCIAGLAVLGASAAPLPLEAAPFPAAPAPSGAAEYVVIVSVDGLRPDVVTFFGPTWLPHFHRLRIEGTFTDNARDDFDYTITLPNHTCEITGRGVLGPDGHGVSFNSDSNTTIALVHGSYVAGVFDAAHDHGLSTALYAGKSKFSLFERSWNAVNGAPDTVGADDGRDKIDTYLNTGSMPALASALIAELETSPRRLSFIHLAEPDAEGHAHGWMSGDYLQSIMRVDTFLGELLACIEASPALAGRTAVVLTADHGGAGTDHGDPTIVTSFRVPFYAWGPGIPAGVDLYLLNPASRLDPGDSRPDYEASPQPVRNGEAANAALDLLGLPAVQGSTIDAAQDLLLSCAGGACVLPAVAVTSPGDGAYFATFGTITIEAAASAPAGAIARVEFYANAKRIGEDAESPYRCDWIGVPSGQYRITARAVQTDSLAAAASIRCTVDIPTAAAASEEIAPRMLPVIYPNPASGDARVEFFLPKRDRIEIALFDLSGRRVAKIFSGWLEAGRHAKPLGIRKLAPGLYVFRMAAGEGIMTGKIMIVR